MSLETTQQINVLKDNQHWNELNAFYIQLSQSATNLDERLFFDWERATLLATELNDPSGAIEVLTQAALAGGPLELIAPQIEAIRSAASTHMTVQVTAQQAYRNLIKHAPLSRVSVEIQAWLRSITVDLANQSTDFDEVLEDELDESILDSIDIVAEEIVSIGLAPEATLVEPPRQ